jgi:7-alpha-hydroxysteroid dehydrogenase
MPTDGFSYEGKKTIVTGAGRGIGRAIALSFAQRGGDVALAARSKDELEAVAAEIEGMDRKAWVLPTDMSDLDQGLGMIEKAHEAMGGIDVLVNNAGGLPDVEGAAGMLNEATPKAFEAIYRLNVQVPFFVTMRTAGYMAKSGGGAILNIVSIDGISPAPGEGLYGSAKAALVSLTQTLAIELGRHNIRVNGVAPALIDTQLVAPYLVKEGSRAQRASMYPINRIGLPEDIAGAAVYLCSDAAGWTSGQTLAVSGGQQAATDVTWYLRATNPIPKGFEI